MKLSGYFLILLSLLFMFTSSAQEANLIDTTIVPPEYANVPGTGVFTGPLASTARTYQLLIHENYLTTLAGKELTGISFRLPQAASVNWPAADISYSNYDIYLSGSVPPANRSLTFADNVVGTQTKVKSGTLNMTAGIYPSGGSPNMFGKEITFDTVWTYNAGHLLIEIRHSGSNGTSSSIDALTTSTSGYGGFFSACWVGSYTGITGSQGNFGVVRISADNPIPVELLSFTAEAKNNSVVLNWSTATEQNNYGFEVQKLLNDQWDKIGFVPGAGTTTEPKNYSFMDNNLNAGKYIYRLRQIDFDGTVSYSNQTEAEIDASPDYSLEQNYPNPFNPATVIEFSLKEKAMVRLSVYNSLGEEVALLINEERESGFHKINFNASKLNSGIYYYEIKAGSWSSVRKMLLLK